MVDLLTLHLLGFLQEEENIDPYDTAYRRELFTEYIEYQFDVNRQHPDVVKLLEIWEKYITLPKEDVGLYDVLKRQIIYTLGNYAPLLLFTYSSYLHQTYWLWLRGRIDHEWDNFYSRNWDNLSEEDKLRTARLTKRARVLV